MSTAIEVRNVSKRFRLYHEQFTSLKQRMMHGGKVPFEEFWALRDIDLSVDEGTTYGLLGHNGSGKSTLLKCIAGIIQPTTGEIVTRGRVAALLELGAGFQPELSGRENIYLNASLLGMSRSFVDSRFDEIVEFAELAPFIDNQVKYYSSGMYVRLGFAVAVNMEPDILIVDEVLAVGDELFQRKCLERVKEFQREGRTIVVVSHSPDLIRQVCTNAAVLDHGVLVGAGTPAEAVRSFREHLLRRKAYAEADQLGDLITLADEEVSSSDAGGVDGQVAADRPARHSLRDQDLQITGVRFEHIHQDERSYIVTGEPLTLRIGYYARRRIDDVQPGVSVHDQEGRLLFGANSLWFPTDPLIVEPGYGEFVFEFDKVPLLDGTYPVTIGLVTENEATVYDWHEQQYSFGVINPTLCMGTVLVAANITNRALPQPDPVRDRLGA
ncbi:MAG: ABC transporter ATP-binding protein [Actinomycetota bacterium]|nr:ABC transporter ATP-binding protein [Actinomycetota bacterium]